MNLDDFQLLKTLNLHVGAKSFGNFCSRQGTRLLTLFIEGSIVDWGLK